MLPTPQRHVVVTGASGYIGKRFCLLATKRGWQVTAFSRHRPAGLPAAITHVPYALGSTLPALPADATAVLHLAYDAANALSDDVEIGAAKALFDAARTAGRRCSSRPTCSFRASSRAAA